MKFPSKKRRLLIFILIGVLLIVLLNLFQKEVKNFFYTISAPIQKALFRVGDRVSDFFGAFIRIKSLKSELGDLKLKNQELISQIVTLEGLKNENEILREALDVGLKKDFKLIIIQVIAKDISQDSILIDKGSDDGVSENMPVITQEKVLTGKVNEVYKNFSKVMLISNKKSSFDAKVQKDEKDISGIIKGQGNFKILFDLVPREELLSEGDIVQTSALGGKFPKGLLVGQIKEIKKSDVEPFQQAEIELTFDIFQTENLFIILNF